MDVCSPLEKEVTKVYCKCLDYRRNVLKLLQESIDQLTGIRHDLDHFQDGADLTKVHSILLSSSTSKLKESLNLTSAEHKGIHSVLSKLGRSIDRLFTTDFNSVVHDTDVFQGDNKNFLNTVICEHFLRAGMLDISETLTEEANVSMEDFDKQPFLELHQILDALKNRDLDPALEWAKRNRERLAEHHSNLEFKLHRLRFLELIKLGPNHQLEVIEYSKNFSQFASSHHREIQMLMGTLLFLRSGLDHGPYSDLFNPDNWLEICDAFNKDACLLMGFSVESPLSISVSTGCKALPPLLNIKAVMQQRQCSGIWTTKDELPVEIDLGDEHRYHSVFACPILRQQSSSQNPPVRLVCGHVISRDALHKLTMSTKIKCPYCPVEQLVMDTKEIFF